MTPTEGELVSESGPQSSAPLEIREIPLGDPQLKAFVKLPWKLYKNDPHWTPHLSMDLLGNKVLGAKGLLTDKDHAYQKFADTTHFMAYRNGEAVGRISAAINHRFNDYYDSKFGFFGFFEVIEDYEVAEALLDAAKAWISDKGMKTMRGPGEYSNATHERQALLIKGFDTDPAMELTHNPPYYQEFMERYGLVKTKDYVAHMLHFDQPIPDRLTEIADKIRARGRVTTRPLDMKHFNRDVKLVVEIYNEAWAKNWGFLPITDEEADIIAEGLKMVADPGLARFAYIDGEPVAVLGAFPDPNYWLRPRWKWYGDSDVVRIARLLKGRRHTPRVRLMFFGIRPGWRRLGIDALLFDEIHEYAVSNGYKECDISLLLENNDLVIRASEFMGAEQYKTYRIFDMKL